jgi:glycosyltransferase involved in cell wall biosynthesis
LQRALELAGGAEKRTILHCNNAHVLAPLRDYAGVTLAQINDYRAAEVWKHPLAVLRRHGPRGLTRLTWRHRREARVMETATRIVCNSVFSRDRMAACYGTPAERLIVIHKAVDLKLFRRPEALPEDPFPAPANRAQLVTVGTDWRTKGVPELLAALAIVRKRVPAVHLTIGGPSRVGDLTALRKLAARHGVGDLVSLPGRIARKQLPLLLWHSDVFVLASHEEALAVSALEAMAAGLPVIATRVGGVPEVVRSADEGVLIEPGDVRALAAAIIGLVTNEPRRKVLAQAAAQRASSFGVDAMIQRVRELYCATNVS